MSLGLGLVIWSLYSIRREIERGNLELTKGLDGVSDKNLERIIYYLDELEKQMNEMNTAFYDLVSDLEGSYSIHDKEISLVEERLEKIEKLMTASPIKKSESRDRRKTDGKQIIDEASEQVSASQKKKREILNKFEELADIDLVEKMAESKWEETTPTHSSANETSTKKAKVMSLSPDEALDMKRRILELRKEGHSLSQIAKILNVGIGELQLFLKLNMK